MKTRRILNLRRRTPRCSGGMSGMRAEIQSARNRPLARNMLVVVGALALSRVGAFIPTIAAGRPSRPGLDAQLSTQLGNLGFTGVIESTLTPARPSARPAARRPGPAAVVRHDHRPERRQLLRRLPFADDGFGDTQSIAIGIDNNGSSGRPRRPAQPCGARRWSSTTAFYPSLMWNSRFVVALGRPVRQRPGLPVPAAGGDVALLPAAPARRAGVHPADRADRGRRLRLPGRQRRDPRRGAAPAQRGRRATDALRPRLPRGAAGGADHLRHVRAGRSPSSSSRSPLPMRRSTGSRAASAMRSTERRSTARCCSSARPAACACHAVSGASNEMFSDFREHVIGVPQIVPSRDERRLRRPGRERGLRPRAVHGRPGRPLQVPHLAAAQRRPAARVHAQRRVHDPRGRDPPPPRRLRVGARVRAGDAGPRRGPDRPDRPGRAVLARVDPLLATPQDLTERSSRPSSPSSATASSTRARNRTTSAGSSHTASPAADLR